MHRQLDWCTARLASAAGPHRKDDLLAGVDQLLHLEAKIVELVVKVADVAAHALVSAIGGRLDPRAGGGPLDLGVVVAQAPLETFMLERLNGTAHNLDVLLRHRLLRSPAASRVRFGARG